MTKKPPEAPMVETLVGTLACPFCEATFDKPYDFKRHRRSHPPEDRAIPCPHCPRTFKTRPAWLLHIDAYHTPGYDERRFWKKVNKDGPTPSHRPDLGPCWVWTASRQQKGYGRFSYVGGKYAQAHRFAYELLVGPVPEGLSLDHLCRRPSCVNPSHLEPVTHKVNIARGIHATRSHCKRGHPYSGDNLGRDRKGHRMCLACRRLRAMANHPSIREVTSDRAFTQDHNGGEAK